jgi:hypothetical protein
MDKVRKEIKEGPAAAPSPSGARAELEKRRKEQKQ